MTSLLPTLRSTKGRRVVQVRVGAFLTSRNLTDFTNTFLQLEDAHKFVFLVVFFPTVHIRKHDSYDFGVSFATEGAATFITT